jgi:hypothetical protein
MADSSGPEPVKKRRRGPGRPFRKGESGNPGGLSAERRAFLSETRRDQAENIKAVLARLVDEALKGQAWAITDYLDRMGVKMPDKLEVSGEDGAPLAHDPKDLMTSEALRRHLAELRARDNHGGGSGTKPTPDGT